MRRALAVGVVCAGVLVALSALTLQEGCASEAGQPSAPAPIVVGVSLGLTKDLASFTAPLRDAIRAAEGEINAGGGLLGRQLRFEVVDDQSDEADIVTGVARRFADERVAAVIGPIGSGQVKATQQLLAEKNIVQITPAATSVELADLQGSPDRFLFRTTPADDFQGAAVILLASQPPSGATGDAGVPAGEAKPCRRLALAYIDNPYGSSMARVISEKFPKAGRTVVSQKKLPLQAAGSYAAEVAEIITSGPECLALISYERAGAQFIRDFKASPGYAALAAAGFFFIGTDGIFTQGFLELSRNDPSNDTSPSSAEGVYGTNPDTQPGTTEYNAFRTIFASYFPLKATDDAPPFAANTYDAAILIALAIQKAGSATNRIAIRDALRDVSAAPGTPVTPADVSEALLQLRNGGDVDYKGASGNVDLLANGNVNGGFIVWRAVRDTATNRVVYRTVGRYTTEALAPQIQ